MCHLTVTAPGRPAGTNINQLSIIARKTGKTKNKEQVVRLTFVMTSLTYEEFTAWGCYM